MKEQQHDAVLELSGAELRQISGGVLWQALLITGIGLLISEWESTKDAVVDAWNGTYDPPD